MDYGSEQLPSRGINASRIDFRDAVNAIVRGAPLAILIALISGVIAFSATRQMDYVYEATTSLLVTQPPTTLGGVDILRPPPADVRVYQQVLTEPQFIRTALQRLDGINRDSASIKAFQQRMRVSVETQEVSSIITLTVRDNDPNRAATNTNALAQALIDWDRGRVNDLLSSSIAALERSIAELDAELATVGSSEASPEVQRMQTLAATLREQRVRELESLRIRSTSAVILGLLEPLNQAVIPTDPVGPRLVFNTFVAVVLGAAFAYALQFAVWALRRGVKTKKNLAALVPVPVLSVFPKPKKGSYRLSPDSVSFLRFGLARMLEGKQNVVIGITCCSSFAEKTGVALSLAESFSRARFRTLLLDADLRLEGPGIGLRSTESRVSSLNDLLNAPSGPIQPLRVVVDQDLSFDVIPVQSPVAQSSELISGGLLPLIDRMRQAYDVIVVDLPPVLASPDAIAAAPSLSGFVLAVGADTEFDAVRAAADTTESSGTELLGTVLTGVTVRRNNATPTNVRRIFPADKGSRTAPSRVPRAKASVTRK